MALNSTTKSIDVGSMFLIDLTVHESESNGSDLGDAITEIGGDSIFPGVYHKSPETATITTHQLSNENRSQRTDQRSSLTNLSIDYHHRHHQHSHHRVQEEEDNHEHEYGMGNSLDRLASAIGKYKPTSTTTMTNHSRRPVSLVMIVKPQPPPEINDQQSSLSDESFASSEGSLSATSFTASSDDDIERGSTTTREDSGVLDMKDLDSQLNNSYDENEHIVELCHHNQQRLHHQQEKPISTNITATNLINKSANNHNSSSSNNNSYIRHPNRLTSNNNYNNDKPTNNSQIHHHHNHHRSQSSKRSMSTSLPIQVPARQMKKDLNKLKLNLINEDPETPSATEVNGGKTQQVSIATYGFHGNQTGCLPVAAVIDDVEFLEQEYNENHQNHYPTDEFDEERLRADENPMKLFESIQALARSLHEDAELFGSLPPKRMLESPIRSLALA